MSHSEKLVNALAILVIAAGLAQEISTDIGKLRRLEPVARDRHIGAVR